MSDAAAVDTGSTEASNLPSLESANDTASIPHDDIQAAIDAVSGKEDTSHGQQDTRQNESSSSKRDRHAEVIQKEDTKPTEQPGPKSSAWASLHKQKLEFQQQRDAFAKERTETARIKALIDNAKTDRLSALEALGYTDVKGFIDGLVEDGGRMTPERQKVLELEKKIADRERRESEEVETRAQQQRLSNQRTQLDGLHNQVVQHIKDHHNESIVNIDGSSQMIMQEMDRLAGEHGVMPDIQQAIENVTSAHEKSFRAILENPRAQSIAREILASSTSSSAPRPKASKQTIDSQVGSGTAPTKPSGPYDPSDELEQMVKWVNTQR